MAASSRCKHNASSGSEAGVGPPLGQKSKRAAAFPAPCRRPRCTDRTPLAGETVKSYNMEEEGGAHALEQEVVVRPHYQQSHSGPD